MLLVAAGVASAATVVSSSREGNSVFLTLSDGNARIEWLNESSFRFSRRWEEELPKGSTASSEPVLFTTSETPEALTYATKYVTVTVSKRGVLVRTTDMNGGPMMADASEIERRDGGVTWERLAPAQARFFGLGARDDASIELRGSRITGAKPFLISSLGYGEWHVAAGDYTFDVGRATPQRYRIEARGTRNVDYYFFYGPAPKQIFEQLLILNGPIPWLSPSEFGLLRPSSIPASATVLNRPGLLETIHRLINASFSGEILPAISLDAYESRRAIQLGTVAPMVAGSRPNAMNGTIRSELTAYLTTYMQEARERGLPMLRPLPMQFPKDADAARVSDEFMLGDELLAAPLVDDRAAREIYFPMGIWTRLSDNSMFQGRKTVTVEGDELPLFSRNGAILPLGSNPMKLHYFPRLGGEFFIFESDLGEYSQVHAGPAGDFMRLEMESKKDRDYEWVVHHLDRPHEITAGETTYLPVEIRERLRPGSWFYDAGNKNLHVRALAAANADVIINIAF